MSFPALFAGPLTEHLKFIQEGARPFQKLRPRYTMKKLSAELLAETLYNSRKSKKLSMEALSSLTGIHRSMIGRAEKKDYIPTIEQLEKLSEVLGFEITDLFVEENVSKEDELIDKKYNIAVAGTGYVGLSIATLLAQHNHVTAVDIIPEKVDLINKGKSPIQDNTQDRFGLSGLPVVIHHERILCKYDHILH